MLNNQEKPPSNLEGVTVFISNLSEDVWPFIASFSHPKVQKYEIDENAYLADRDLFSLANEDKFVLILPKSVSEEFLSYYRSIFGTKFLKILVPKVHSGKICEDILKDQTILNELIRIANSIKRLTLISYSVSHYFLELVKYLKSKGIFVFTPEAPEEQDAWTVNFFGSKSGIRQLAQTGKAEEPDLLIADGFICSGIEDAARMAAQKYVKEGGVVIKTNKGHSGLGVIILRPGDAPSNFHEAQATIIKRLKDDAYWDKFPIVVESFVNVNYSVGGGFPNVEFRIQKTGKIEFLYFCGMRISSDGVFKGVEICDKVMNDQIEAQMIDTGFYIGEQYAKNGYRGYYDVDFIAGKNGKVYVTESNTRRTGGTHVYQIAEKLFGEDFLYMTYALSYNTYPLKKTFSFVSLKNTLEPILFNKKTKEGLIIISENLLLQNKLAYVIFGKTKKRALEIEDRMEKLLNQS